MTTTEPRHLLLKRLAAEASRQRQDGVSIVDALEFRRDQYGLSQKEFASILGISPPKYSEFLHGRRNLPKKAAGRAYLIGVHPEVLLVPLQAPSFCSDAQQIKARKPHRCTWCGEPIAASETYWRWYSINDDGYGATSKMHPECRDALRDDDEHDYMPYDNDRPATPDPHNQQGAEK